MVSKKEQYSYATACFGQNLVYALAGMLAYFFQFVLGINGYILGIIILVSKIWDAINDPLMGIIVDKTRTKWGQFRPYLFIAPLLIGIFLILCFAVPNLSDRGQVLWITIFYILLFMAYTLYDVPYWSIIPTLTQDPSERTKVAALPRIFGLIGLVAATGLIPYLKNNLGFSEKNNFIIIAIATSIICIITGWIAFWGIKEKVEDKKSQSSKDLFKVIFQNKPLLILLGVNLGLSVTITLKQVISLPYFQAYFNNDSLMGPVTIVGMLCMVITMIFTPKYTEFRGKKQACFDSLWLSLIGCILFFFAEANLIILYISSAFTFAGFGMFSILMTSMLSDTVEYAQWKLGIRSESMIFSSNTFIAKLSAALAGLIGPVSLEFIQFNRFLKGDEIPNALMGMRIISGILPAIILVISMILLYFYPLNEKKFSEILSDLNTRQEKV